jgi:small ligand-binding sensory domain FIST
MPDFTTAFATAEDTDVALAQIQAELRLQLTRPADLALVFFSPQHASRCEDIANAICDVCGTEQVLGCTGEAIVAGDQEIEGQPAISVWVAQMPDVRVRTFQLSFERAADGGAFAGWPADLVDGLAGGQTLILLGEPFSFPADVLIARVNESDAAVPVIGGMASGGWGPGQNKLLLGRQVHDEGAVAAVIEGAIRIHCIVSQGCRPIGKPFVVTKSDRNVILELSGKTAMARLHEVYETLSDREKELVRNGLHVGRVLSEYQDEFRRGDFLVRNVVGADPNTGAIAIGDYVKTGVTVQFHIRDADTADDDLRELLADAVDEGHQPVGALLFTCNGRGTRLFNEDHHDARCVQAAFNGLPVAGFFAQGELGPVHKKNFLHGFTASLALFEAEPESK